MFYTVTTSGLAKPRQCDLHPWAGVEQELHRDAAKQQARLAKLAAVFVAEGKKKGLSPRCLDSIKKKAQRLIREVVIWNEEGPSCSATSAGGPPPAGRRMEDVMVPQDGGPLHQVQQHVYIDSLLNPQGQMAKATGGTWAPLVGIEEALEEAEASMEEVELEEDVALLEELLMAP
ncbi:hypothetical protein niasHT_019963 [Heterodera trifolii]|uniref:Uncharacterized protein n=1 Tax=Heterodera trifolii TaxID=157864 RepID=A0ABD2LJB8_9BILA